MNTAYVYGLRASDSDTYFYIGSTKYDPHHRLRQHIDAIRTGKNRNPHLANKINKIGHENVVIDVIELVEETQRFNREYEIIRSHIERGVALTNIVMSARDFEMNAYTREWDEFEPTVDHIYAIVDAFEFGVQVTGDKVAFLWGQFLEQTAQHIINKHLDDFLNTVSTTFRNYYDTETAQQKTADIYKRILTVLERKRGG